MKRLGLTASVLAPLMIGVVASQAYAATPRFSQMGTRGNVLILGNTLMHDCGSGVVFPPGSLVEATCKPTEADQVYGLRTSNLEFGRMYGGNGIYSYTYYRICMLEKKSVSDGAADLEHLYTFRDFPVFMGCVDGPAEEDLTADMV